MSSPRFRKCTCGAEVVWIHTTKKNWVPCEAEPLRGFTAAGELVEIYLPHGPKCPDAGRHRRGRVQGMRMVGGEEVIE